MNVVMTGDGRARSRCRRRPSATPFTRDALDELLELAARRDRDDRRGPGGGGRAASCLAPSRPWLGGLLASARARGRARRRDRLRAGAPRARGGAPDAPARRRRLRALHDRLGATACTTSSSRATVVRADPTRIAAQIVTGIGFLGAGVIIRQGFSVRGLTTAATLWVVAAIGMAAGAGYYSAAVIATALVAPRALAAAGRGLPGARRLRPARPPARRAPRGEPSATASTRRASRRPGRVDRGRAGGDRRRRARRRLPRPSGSSSRLADSRRRRGRVGALSDVLVSRTRTRRASCARRSPAGRSSRSTRTSTRRRPATTYYENARAKAASAGRRRPRTRWVIGEDSGLEVDGLGGAPGRPLGALGRRRPGRPAARRLDGVRATPAAPATSASSSPSRRRRGGARHRRARGRDRRRAARQRGLRLRPGLRPRGRGRDRRGARQRVEGARTPTAPARAGAPRRL